MSAERMKKKIMIVVPYLYDGGAERVASIWASELARDGHYDVHLLTYYRLEKEYELDSNVKRSSILNDVIVTDSVANDYGKIDCVPTITKILYIRKYIKEYKIDVVIPFLDYPGVHCSLACFFNNNVKVVHTMRNNPWVFPKGLKKNVRDFFIKKDGYLIVQTEDQSLYYKNYKNLKYFVVPNPINRFCEQIEKQYKGQLEKIISIGRLSLYQKNQGMIIEVVKKLNKQGISVLVDIYGDGPDKDKLSNMIKDNGLEKQIHLMGNSKDILNIEVQYDLFLMTSFFEGFPNSLLEAMAEGMPVISTNCKTGPNSMIINEKNGYLVEINDVEQVCNLIINLKKNPNKLEEIGMNARKTVFERFSTHKVVDDLKRVVSIIVDET